MLFLIKLVTIFGVPKLWITIVELTILATGIKLHCRYHIIPRKHSYWTDLVLRHQCLVAVDTILYWWCKYRLCFLLLVVGFNTLLAESLQSFLDESGKRNHSADMFKFLWSADHPAIWMSQTSFILDKPVLPVRARILWSFTDSFCTHAP